MSDQQARRFNPFNETDQRRRFYDEPDMHDWSDRDIGMYAVRRGAVVLVVHLAPVVPPMAVQAQMVKL
jgi:hypothetical protein